MTFLRYWAVAIIFEAFIFREQPIQFLFAKSNFTNGDTELRPLHSKFSRIGCVPAKFAKYKTPQKSVAIPLASYTVLPTK